MIEQKRGEAADNIMTVPEAADCLRVSRSTIWRWCRDGTLSSAFKIGRNWRIHRSEVEQIIGGKLIRLETSENHEVNQQYRNRVT